MAEPCRLIEGIQDKASHLDGAELADYVRGKLNRAIQLACEAEHERRSCRWESAEVYQRQWEEVIAELKRLLPLVRKSGEPLFTTVNPQIPSRSKVPMKSSPGH